MKKLSTFIIAAALLFGMAQCKKQETPATSNAEYSWVHITMKVNGGEKYNIYPNTGAVVYTDTDKIYVSNGGKYRGVLTYSNGAFTGDLAYNDENPMSTTDHLHFYFLGGLTFDDPAPLTTASFDVSIANQSSKLPVLSYGMSRNLYTDGNATYSSTLENQCALVEFTTNEIPVETAVSISEMQNTVQIDFANHTIAPTGTAGSITLHAESTTSRWAILLPNEEGVTATAVADGYPTTQFSIPTIDKNSYWTQANGAGISFELPGYPITWNSTDISGINLSNSGTTTISDITASVSTYGSGMMVMARAEFSGSSITLRNMGMGTAGGNLTFSSNTSSKISKIEITYGSQTSMQLSSGWSNSGNKLTWQGGSPVSSVTLSSSNFVISGVSKIVFTMQD